ncbi:MAG: hypothetical protein U0S12_11910 [Fimbriimonadales bacterium]
MSGAALSLTIFAALASCGTAASGDSSGKSKQGTPKDIKDQYQQMVNAYSTRNASAFMAPFAKDATGDGSFPSNYAYPGPESGKLTRKQLEGFYVGWMTDFVPRTGGMPNPSISVMIDKREDKGDLATVSGVISVIMPLHPNSGGNMDGYFAFVDQWSKSGEYGC